MTEYGDMLFEEARATLGARGGFEAEQVVKDFEEELLEGAVSLERGRRSAVGLLRQRIRAMARSRRRELEGAEILTHAPGEPALHGHTLLPAAGRVQTPDVPPSGSAQ